MANSINESNPFSGASVPDLNQYADFMQLNRAALVRYVERNGGVSLEPVTISQQTGYASCTRDRDGVQIGFGSADLHDLSGLIAIWQIRYPNYRFD